MKKCDKTILIYRFRNIKNDKCYIGVASNYHTRQQRHWNHLSKGNHHSQKLQRSYDKHEKENFIFEIIEDNIETLEEAFKKEIYWIGKYDSYENGYNMTLGGAAKHGIQTQKHARIHHSYFLVLEKL